MTDLEEYEKAYLERLKKKSGKKPKPKQTEHYEEELEHTVANAYIMHTFQCMSKINNLSSLFQNPFLLYHEPLSYGEPAYPWP